MKCGKRRLLLPLLVALFSFSSVAESEAIVLIYKLSFNGKARYFPKGGAQGNSFVNRGYLIYDTNNPGAASTIEVFGRTKTFQVNGAMRNNVVPSAIGFFNLDRNNDAYFETKAGNIGFTNGGLTVSRSYLGRIPKQGIRFGNSVPITGFSPVLRGLGSVTATGTDVFRTSDVWRMMALTSAFPNDTNTGINAVVAFLVQRGFSQI